MGPVLIGFQTSVNEFRPRNASPPPRASPISVRPAIDSLPKPQKSSGRLSEIDGDAPFQA